MTEINSRELRHLYDYRFRARDWWFSTLVFPITFLVFILFWGLFAYDRELVMPKRMDAEIDPLFNHMVRNYNGILTKGLLL